jgi:hypothetical protein
MVVLAQASPAAKIDTPFMVHPRAGLHAVLEQQHDHHERAVVSIHHGDIALAKRLQQFS